MLALSRVDPLYTEQGILIQGGLGDTRSVGVYQGSLSELRSIWRKQVDSTALVSKVTRRIHTMDSLSYNLLSPPMTGDQFARRLVDMEVYLPVFSNLEELIACANDHIEKHKSLYTFLADTSCPLQRTFEFLRYGLVTKYERELNPAGNMEVWHILDRTARYQIYSLYPGLNVHGDKLWDRPGEATSYVPKEKYWEEEVLPGMWRTRCTREPPARPGALSRALM